MSEAFLAAAKARLESSWSQGRVYELGSVPGLAVTPYVSMSLSTPAPEHTGGDGAGRSRRYRLACQVIGRTSGECLRAGERVHDAFNGHSLDVAGFDVSPPDPDEWVSSDPRRDDDAEDGGLLSMAVVIPFYAYPEES